MDIYDELLMRVANGEKFRISFKKRSLSIGKDKLIDNGKIKDGYTFNTNGNLYENVERVYEDYYYSRPSERSDNNRHPYFKALRYEELSDEQLCDGAPRELMRARLECNALAGIMGGSEWKGGSWYWKSKKYPDLIILKSWLETEE